MVKQQTFSIIKPNAVAKNVIGEIEERIEGIGLQIVAMKMVYLTRQQAEGFYAEHQGKSFFEPLVTFMTSGPIIVQVLEGEDAIMAYRQLMGATDPTKAEPNTLRALFADSLTQNAVHGSDSLVSAQREIAYFFAPTEVYAR